MGPLCRWMLKFHDLFLFLLLSWRETTLMVMVSVYSQRKHSFLVHKRQLVGTMMTLKHVELKLTWIECHPAFSFLYPLCPQHLKIRWTLIKPPPPPQKKKHVDSEMRIKQTCWSIKPQLEVGEAGPKTDLRGFGVCIPSTKHETKMEAPHNTEGVL